MVERSTEQQAMTGPDAELVPALEKTPLRGQWVHPGLPRHLVDTLRTVSAPFHTTTTTTKEQSHDHST